MITHDSLCLQAERFLKNNGFGVVFHDKFRAVTGSGELPDALGFRNGASCLIECKTSRADFLPDRKKRFRIDPKLGMGDWRFMLTPKGLVTVDELPTGWDCWKPMVSRFERYMVFHLTLSGTMDRLRLTNKQSVTTCIVHYDGWLFVVTSMKFMRGFLSEHSKTDYPT